MLYQNNIFDCNHIDTILYLQMSVLPQRLSQIRILNLSGKDRMGHSIPHDLATWQKACGMFANSFCGLQKLTVHLNECRILPDEYSRRAWQPLLEALRGIRVENRFVVFMPWSEDQCAKTTKESTYPFQLVSKVEGPQVVFHLS
jgi:hypothetical protein